jgi:hypothetical protein
MSKGVRCGNHGRGDKVYHASVDDVRDCYAGRYDDDGAAAAEQAYERHLENAGSAEAQSQRDWEDRNGVIQFSDAYWDSQIQAAEREEDERVARYKLDRDSMTVADWYKANEAQKREKRESGWATAAQERDYAERDREACSGGLPATWKRTRPTQDGMYRDPDKGTIWKVQWNLASGDGRKLYAKLLVVDVEPVTDAHGKLVEKGKRHFEYAPGALRDIDASWRMTLEEAKEFGALYGTCVYGHALTAEKSIAKRIGPVCEAKYGMPA